VRFWKENVFIGVVCPFKLFMSPFIINVFCSKSIWKLFARLDLDKRIGRTTQRDCNADRSIDGWICRHVDVDHCRVERHALLSTIAKSSKSNLQKTNVWKAFQHFNLSTLQYFNTSIFQHFSHQDILIRAKVEERIDFCQKYLRKMIFSSLTFLLLLFVKKSFRVNFSTSRIYFNSIREFSSKWICLPIPTNKIKT